MATDSQETQCGHWPRSRQVRPPRLQRWGPRPGNPHQRRDHGPRLPGSHQPPRFPPYNPRPRKLSPSGPWPLKLRRPLHLRWPPEVPLSNLRPRWPRRPLQRPRLLKRPLKRALRVPQERLPRAKIIGGIGLLHSPMLPRLSFQLPHRLRAIVLREAWPLHHRRPRRSRVTHDCQMWPPRNKQFQPLALILTARHTSWP